jgi:sulfur carrier protein
LSDTIWVNGKERPLTGTTTVRVLLQALDLPESGLAVAVDLEVIPQSQHASTVLKAGARVEIIRAVGGG